MNSLINKSKLHAAASALAIAAMVLSLVPMQAYAANIIICKKNNSGELSFNSQQVNTNAANNGLANSGVNGDIVPPTDPEFPAGINWTATYAGFTGQQIWENGCAVPTPPQTTGTLTVNKIISGITGIATSLFGYSINNTASVAFEADGSNSQTVNIGAFNVVESGVTNGQITVGQNTYSVSYSDCSGTLTTTPALCTITNTYVPQTVVNGCTDPLANNYVPTATSGNPDAENCTYTDACPNLPDNQTTVPEGYVLVGGQCVAIVNGCTDSTATNYNAAATPGNPQATACTLNYVSQCGANPNLLTNGDFETPAPTANSFGVGFWEIFPDITGWTATNGIEIWDNMLNAVGGNQVVELDTTGSSAISQSYATIAGATYELRFDFAARSNASSLADNSVVASVDGNPLVTTNTTNTNWTTYGQTFTADASTDITLADVGTSNGLGTIIDNVVLCLVNDPNTGGGGDEDTYRIQGYVWHDDNENQDWDSEFIPEQETTELLEDPLTGWTVNITDGKTTLSTTTDSEGYYYFEVPEGTWTITEVVQDGWGRTTQESHVVTVPGVLTLGDSIINFIIPTAHAAVIGDPYGDYNFGNNETRRGGGGGGGNSAGDRDGEVLGDSDSVTPEPFVLGEQTSAVPIGAPDTGKGGAALEVMGQFLALPRRRN